MAESTEDRILALAAAVMGYFGGQVKSAKKTKAVRENGTKGGRPRGPNYKPRNRPGKPKVTS